MANEVNATLAASITNATAPPAGSPQILMVKKVYYFTIAIIAILGNTLVAAFFYQNRKTLLKKTYYIILLALSLTDILTAVILLATPAFVFQSGGLQEPTSRISLLIYCKVLWGRLLLFICGVASVYLIVLLTVDRWIAVIKHTKYKTMINRGRVIKSIIVCYIFGILFILPSHPNVEVYPSKPSGQRCSFVSTPHLQITVTINFIAKAVFPSIVVAIMYAHIAYKMKESSAVANQQRSTKETRKRITKIALIASFAILLCWLPNQINLLLFAYKKSSVQSTFHDFTVGLVFMTSCINPFLYGLTSKKFRKGYLTTLKTFASCTRSTFFVSSGFQVNPSNDMGRRKMNQQSQQCHTAKNIPIAPVLNDPGPAPLVKLVEKKDNGGFDVV